MGDPPYEPRKPIEKGHPVTPAEEYLAHLCFKSFLSVWSYPSVYRDQKQKSGALEGKELCDLLVVFGNHVLIFSDKYCAFPNTGKLEQDWARWFRRAISKSAAQAWGAERWLRQFPSRLFLDRRCTKPFPFDLPDKEHMQFHLIVVAHGVSERKRAIAGGSGSLSIDSTLRQIKNHTIPFVVGDLDDTKTFIHILDDASLNTLMAERDTTSDFIEYLDKRADLLRQNHKVLAPGEEELLAIYLTCLNEKQEHYFGTPPVTPTVSLDKIPSGLWATFQHHPQRVEQRELDKVSYLWDGLIEKFAEHALAGTQHSVSEGGFRDTERVLRFMAREPRYLRRELAKALLNILQTTPLDIRRLYIAKPVLPGDPYYVFLLLPEPSEELLSYADYRKGREMYLQACCMVTKLMIPSAIDIIGIATECGLDRKDRSEDSCYLDASIWTEDQDQEAREHQAALGILTTHKIKATRTSEFPPLFTDETF